MTFKKLPLLLGITLLAGCMAPALTGQGALCNLNIQPKFTAGQYRTQTVVSAYTQSSVDHMVVKLYDATHDNALVGQLDIASSSLTAPIVFNYLHPDTHYQLKAYAYKTAGTADANLISDPTASAADVTLTTDQKAYWSELNVRLLDRTFSGQASAGMSVTNGTYLASDSVTFSAGYQVASLCGGQSMGYADGIGAAAKLFMVFQLCADASGNVYFADYNNSTFRKCSPDGTVTTLVGSPSVAAETDGTLSTARLQYPMGVARDAAGDFYVCEYGGSHHYIRKISLTGNSVAVLKDNTNTAHTFSGPTNLVFDSAGNLFVCDFGASKIFKIAPDGTKTVFAGSGASATTNGTGAAAAFRMPWGLAIDSQDNLYVAETSGNTIRKITPGAVVTTLAGSGAAGSQDGTGTAATFSNPRSIAVDPQRNLYVADQGNHVIRKITPAGVVTTFAGTKGSPGYVSGPAETAKFSNPIGITRSPSGVFYVGEYSDIRKID